MYIVGSDIQIHPKQQQKPTMFQRGIRQCYTGIHHRRMNRSGDTFARIFSGKASNNDDDREELRQFLTTQFNIGAEAHDGIFKAMESVYGKDLKVSHLESFGKTGMESLAASVQQELKQRQGRQGRPSTNIRISIPHHGTSFDLRWRLGESLLDLAQTNPDLLGEYMEGTCGGNMSCCTCHVYISQPEFQNFLKDPNEGELDMLDLAYEPTDDSRLGCQVTLTEEMIQSPAQFEIQIPAGVNNVWN